MILLCSYQASFPLAIICSFLSSKHRVLTLGKQPATEPPDGPNRGKGEKEKLAGVDLQERKSIGGKKKPGEQIFSGVLTHDREKDIP